MKILPYHMITCKVSKKGQVVLPKEIREKMNITTGDILIFREEGGKILIEVIRESLTTVLEKSEPFEESKEFQKKLRDEWE